MGKLQYKQRMAVVVEKVTGEAHWHKTQTGNEKTTVTPIRLYCCIHRSNNNP